MKSKNKAKNSLFNTILIAVCSFVGVGFITGAEVWFYFARFGTASIFGMIIFGLLSFVLSFFSVCTSHERELKISKIKTKISVVGELAVASAMVSGLFETTKTIFERWWWIAFLSAVLLSIILFFYEKKSFLIYNYFVAIFVIFVIVSLFSFNNCFNGDILNFSNKNFNIKNIGLSCCFAALYIFSNVAELRPILEKNSTDFSKRKKIKLSLILSITLVFLILLIEFAFFQNIELSKYSMPFLGLFKLRGGVCVWVFLIGLIMTMISTLEVCLIGAKDKLIFNKNDENFIKLIVIIISLICGQIPFEIYIKFIYPTIAILNLLVFILEIFQIRILSKKQNF